MPARARPSDDRRIGAITLTSVRACLAGSFGNWDSISSLPPGSHGGPVTPEVVLPCPAGPAPELVDPREAARLCIWQPSLHPGLFAPQPPSGAAASGAELLSPAESSGLRLPWLPVEGKEKGSSPPHFRIDRELPAGLGVRVPCFHCCGPDSVSGWRTETQEPTVPPKGKKARCSS